MSIVFGSQGLTVASIVSSSNIVVGTGKHFFIGPSRKSRDANATQRYGGPNVAPMDPTGIQVDGDLILSSSWGYAFRVARIADNGTTTSLYDGAGTFDALGTGLCVDKTRGKAWISRMDGGGIQEYDYSEFKNGGAGPVTVGTKWTTSNSNLPFGGFGYWYWSGTMMAGDWIYLNRLSSYPGANLVERWNPITNVYQTIAVTRGNGSVNYNGGFTYDAVNDRMYQAGLSGGGGIYVITGASTASPSAYYVNTGTFHATDVYPQMYVDPADPNVLVIWLYGYRVAKIDITPCLSSTATPTLIWLSAETDTNNDGWTGLHGCTRPEGLNMAYIRSDRGVGRYSGWVDLDNGVLVGSPFNLIYESAGGLLADYSPTWVKITSAGASPTTYWIWGGYSGGHGHYIWTYPENCGPRLENTWEVVFGTFALAGNAPIKSGNLSISGSTVPSGCSLTFYASNDNGANWQAVSHNTVFDFSTTGTQARIKIVGTGTDVKSSYIKTTSGLFFVFMSIASTDVIPSVWGNKLAGIKTV